MVYVATIAPAGAQSLSPEQQVQHQRALEAILGPIPAGVQNCTYQTFKDTGTVVFQPGCDSETMERAAERAKVSRDPNAGDFAVLGKKLDRIIELLEQQK